MRQTAAVLGVAGVLSVSAAPALGDSDARLQGSFRMRGTLTLVVGVSGEYRGEHVFHTWTFTPACSSGVCDRVKLSRLRGNLRQLDVVRLTRTGPGAYSGRGQFSIPLLCAGQEVKRGGLVSEVINVRITRTKTVGGIPFATRLAATYNNPQRTNRTHCRGSLGRDAASYSGRLASALPQPPAARFTATVQPGSVTASFSDHSRARRGGRRIVAWSWDFGDRLSPQNTSAQRSPSHTFSAPGTYTVTLTVTDRTGLTATASRQVTV